MKLINKYSRMTNMSGRSFEVVGSYLSEPQVVGRLGLQGLEMVAALALPVRESESSGFYVFRSVGDHRSGKGTYASFVDDPYVAVLPSEVVDEAIDGTRREFTVWDRISPLRTGEREVVVGRGTLALAGVAVNNLDPEGRIDARHCMVEVLPASDPARVIIHDLSEHGTGIFAAGFTIAQIPART